MKIEEMKVGDLMEMLEFLSITQSIVSTHFMGIIQTSEEESGEAIGGALDDFRETLPEGWWTVPRLVALTTYQTAVERILEGLKASQRSGR